jgi:hypothetical protein
MTDKNRKRPLGVALVALASLLAFVAVLAIWVDRQMLNTDNWTRASSQMLQDPTIRNRVAERLVDDLYANVDVEAEIRAALPPRAQPLAGPAAGALRNFAERAAKEVLSRPRAQLAWQNANRTAHEQLVSVLKGGGPIVSTSGGDVTLDLRALLGELQARTGVGGRVAGRLPPSAAQVTVMRSDQLEAAQDAFNVLDALPIVSVVLSLALFGIALAVAPGWRRQAVRGYGFGLLAAGLAALATRSLAGDAIVDSLVPTEAGKPAAHDVWEIVTELLDQAAVAAVFYGAVLILGAWLAGPTRLATGVRRVSAPYLREPAIAYAVFAALAAAVVLWWAPTPAMRNPVTAIMLVVLLALGFEGLRRRTGREFPDADRHEFHQRVRDWLARSYQSVRERTVSGGGVAIRRASALGREVTGDQRSAPAAAAPPAAPAPVVAPVVTAPTAADTRVDQLERLARLRDSRVLDEHEFRAEKARILGDAGAPVQP